MAVSAALLCTNLAFRHHITYMFTWCCNSHLFWGDTQQDNLVSLLQFFQNKESRLERILTTVYVVQNYLPFFWTMSIVSYVEVLQKTTTFRRLDPSPSSGGWGRVALLSCARHWIQWLRLALSDEPNCVGPSCPIHLRTETDPVSEMLWSFVKLPHTRRWTESKRSQIVLYKESILKISLPPSPPPSLSAWGRGQTQL
jgi:hypothetical protein